MPDTEPIGPDLANDKFFELVAAGTDVQSAAQTVQEGRKAYKALLPQTDFVTEHFKIPETSDTHDPTAVGAKALTTFNAIAHCSGNASSQIGFYEWLNAIFSIPSDHVSGKFSKQQYLHFMAQKSSGHLHTAIINNIADGTNDNEDFKSFLTYLANTFGQTMTGAEATVAFATFQPGEQDTFPIIAINLRPITRVMAYEHPKEIRKDVANKLLCDKLLQIASQYGKQCLAEIEELATKTRLSLNKKVLPPERLAAICQEIVKNKPIPQIRRIQSSPPSTQTNNFQDLFNQFQNMMASTPHTQNPQEDITHTADSIFKVASAKAAKLRTSNTQTQDNSKPHDWRLPDNSDNTFCSFYGPHCLGYARKICTLRHKLCPVCQEGKAEWVHGKGHERDAKKAKMDPKLKNMNNPALKLPQSSSDLTKLILHVESGVDVDEFDIDVLNLFQTHDFLDETALFLEED